MTPWLRGNGEPCPACALRREAGIKRAVVPCNQCSGVGVMARNPLDVIREAAHAALPYWQEFDVRNGLR